MGSEAMAAVHEARLRVRLGQSSLDYRSTLSDFGQQTLRDAPTAEHAKLCTDLSTDPKPWQWELSDVGRELIAAAEAEKVLDREKGLLDGLVRNGVRKTMSSFQREVDACEQGSPEAELTLVFLIEKALGHNSKSRKLQRKTKQNGKKTQRKSTSGHVRFQPNGKTEALKLACATELGVFMNSTEAATVFESLCLQLDQYDPLEATEKFCRELFAVDNYARVSTVKQVKDQADELAEAAALQSEEPADELKIQPKKPVLSVEQVEALEAQTEAAQSLGAFVVHIVDVLKSSPLPNGFTPDRKKALAKQAGQLASLLSQPALPAAQKTLEYSKRGEAKERIDELHSAISAVAVGAAQATDCNQIAEYLELVYPPLEVLDPTVQNAREQPTINVKEYIDLTASPPSPQSVGLGRCLTLQCSAKVSSSSAGVLAYTWHFVPAVAPVETKPDKDDGDVWVRGGFIGSERALVVESARWYHAGEYTCIMTASKVPGQLLSPPVTIRIVSTAEEAMVANRPLHKLEQQMKQETLRRAEIERECLEQGLPGPSYHRLLHPLQFKRHPQPCTVKRLEPIVLEVVAGGGDDVVEEIEDSLSYPNGQSGLVYMWLKDNRVVQEARTAQQGGHRLEVLHARSGDAGNYLCMLTHEPTSSPRRRQERLLSKPAKVVVTEASNHHPLPSELVHAPLVPLTPRREADKSAARGGQLRQPATAAVCSVPAPLPLHLRGPHNP